MSEPPQLSPFDAKELQFYSELQMSKLFTLYLYGWTVANLPGKLILASCIHILISSVTTQSLGGAMVLFQNLKFHILGAFVKTQKLIQVDHRQPWGDVKSRNAPPYSQNLTTV